MTACAIATLLLAGCGGSRAKVGASSGTARSGSAGRSAGGAGTGGSSAKRGGLEVDSAKPTHFAKVSSSAPTRSGVVKIAYRDIAIDPDAVKVKAGSTIRWTNHDSVPANVTSEGGPMKFSSGNFGAGKSYELKVTRPGVIHYECTLEPTTMNGTIEVVE